MSAITLALCQFRPTKGAPAANLDRIEQLFRTVAASPAPPSVLVLPETIVTGYFLEGGVREHALEASALFTELALRHTRAEAPPLEICLGFYERGDDRHYNSAMWAALGGSDAGIRHVHRKVFLPTYGVFDEERFVDAGRDVRSFPTRFGRAAMLVCEDIWHSITPTIAAVDGAQLIAVVAASPARGIAPDPLHPGQPNSHARWEEIARDSAMEHGVFVAMAQLVGFEGGKAFQGGSMLIGPDGQVLVRAPLFDDATVSHTFDLDDIGRVRSASPLIADLELRLPLMMESLERARKRKLVGDDDPSEVAAEPPARIVGPAARPATPRSATSGGTSRPS